MRLILPFTAALAAVASATPFVNQFAKRDGAAVVAAVNDIADSMTTLNTTVTGYKGGALGTFTALKIEFQCLDLAKVLKDGISTTKDSANFTNAESLDVSGAFLDLQPKIFSTLDNIVAKKPQFDTGLLGIGSLAFLVKSNLEQQQELAAELGTAVTAKLTKAYAGIAPALMKQIDNKFVEALAAYA